MSKPKPPPCPMCRNRNHAVYIRPGEYFCTFHKLEFDDDPGTDVGYDPVRNLEKREEREIRQQQQRRRR